MIDLEKEFGQALNGRDIWLKIKEKYSFISPYELIIFPTENHVLNKEAIKALPVYIDKVFLDRVVAVTDQELVIESIAGLGLENICCEKITSEEMSVLLTYYRLVTFYPHVSVISLAEPYGDDYFFCESEIDTQNFILSAVFKVRG